MTVKTPVIDSADTAADDSQRVITVAERARRLKQRDISFIPNDAFRERGAKRSILGSDLELDFVPEIDVTKSKGLPSHLARLADSPLLGTDEEKTMFRRMNYLLYRASMLRKRLSVRQPRVESVEEIEACLSEAIAVKNRIVAANIRLVISIVKQLSSSPSSFDEMLSEGLLAMMRAVEKFDFDRGFRFSTYATMVIRRQLYRSMKNEHRDRSRFPNADDAILTEQAQESAEPRIGFQGWKRLSETLGRMMKDLDPREQTIIRARFGFDSDGKKQTLQSLAQEFGVCKERVRQLEKRAMAKLRDFSQGKNLEPLVDPEFAMID